MDKEKDNKELKSCCQPVSGKKPQGLWQGLLYGIVPHIFCILFIIFSIVGSTIGATFAGKFLRVPYFFQFLVLLSLAFAFISAFFYLKRLSLLNWSGIKQSWKYLSILFGLTVIINLVLFFGIFPAVANIGSGQALVSDQTLVLNVALPCPGHASIVTQDLLSQSGISAVKYQLNNNSFVVSYNPELVTASQIIGRDIFQEFRAKIISQ